MSFEPGGGGRKWGGEGVGGGGGGRGEGSVGISASPLRVHFKSFESSFESLTHCSKRK